MRKLAALLTLAGVGVQPATGSPLLVSALIVGIHASGHAHSVSIFSDAGHLDLVLSHAEGPDHEGDAAPHHEDQPTTTSESDHVFHVASDNSARATPRSHRVSDAPAPAFALAVSFAPVSISIFRPSSEPRIRASGSLSTIVLRL
jgi:hypothetical protein